MRITHLVGLLLTCSLLLPSTAWSNPRTQGDDGDMPAGGDGPPPEAMEEMDPSAGPPMADILKGCTRTDGLFTFFQNEKTGQTFLALKPEQMNKEFLLSFTLNAGSGGGMFIAPMLWPDIPVYFKQTYRTVQMIVPNTYITADPKSPIARAVKTGTADSVLLTLPLFCQPAPAVEGEDATEEAANESVEELRDSGDDDASDDEAEGAEAEEGGEGDEEAELPPLPEGTVLLDASQIFFSDLLNMGGQVSYLGGGTGIDPMGSFITSIDNFPANTNVELTLNMFGSGFGQLGGSGFVPDPRSTITKMVICMSELPKENGFTPRLSDERIGYFLVMQQDFTDDTLDTRYKRYISRWKLEKKDPTAAISDPVEPIVFWIENTVPHEYREGVRQGIEVWQEAFTEAGFSNAIIAKQMPDDADWDPADIRYNAIRWFVAPGAGFAIGPSRANPYTGQIYDADIGFSADMMGFAQAEYTDLVNPLGIIARERERARATGLYLPPTVKELADAHKHPELYTRNLLPGQSPANRSGVCSQCACNITQEALHEAASAFMASEIMLGERMDREEFIRQFLVAIVAHEVGHTLGLRHNYQASDYHATTALNTAEAVETGLTGSMMDYTGTNLVPAGQHQGEWFQTQVGPYDKAAIKYGYMQIPGTGGKPENELNQLDDIASEWAQPGHGYLTDEDAFGWTASMDPSATAWDLASDNITYYDQQMTIAGQLLDRIPQVYDGDGDRYQKIRTGFGWALRSYMLGAMGVPKYIGGIYHSRNRVGDSGGEMPYTPVPAAKQREALNFIIKHYLKPDSFSFSPELLRSLAMEVEPDFEGTVYMTMRRDFPIHDIVLNAQSMPLMWVYDPIVLRRLQDSSKLLPAGTDQMTIAELFGGIRGAIWEEAFLKQSVGSYRRNLQRMHLQALTSIYLYGAGWYPPDAITLARLDLTTLREALKVAAASTTLDGLSRAHYQECIDQINASLNATTIRM